MTGDPEFPDAARKRISSSRELNDLEKRQKRFRRRDKKDFGEETKKKFRRRDKKFLRRNKKDFGEEKFWSEDKRGLGEKTKEIIVETWEAREMRQIRDGSWD